MNCGLDLSLIVLVIIVIVVIVLLYAYYSRKHRTREEWERNRHKFWIAVMVVIVVAVILYYGYIIYYPSDKKKDRHSEYDQADEYGIRENISTRYWEAREKSAYSNAYAKAIKNGETPAVAAQMARAAQKPITDSKLAAEAKRGANRDIKQENREVKVAQQQAAKNAADKVRAAQEARRNAADNAHVDQPVANAPVKHKEYGIGHLF